MKKTVSGVLVAGVCSFAIGVGAQTTSPGSTTTGQAGASGTQNRDKSAMSKSEDGKSVTVTGCLQQAPDGTGFVLRNASMASGSTGMTGSATGAGQHHTGSSTASGTTGAGTTGSASGTTSGTASGTTASGTTASGSAAYGTGAASKSDLGQTYTLVGGDNLKAHVGHKIQVTGTIAGKAGSSKMGGTQASSGAEGTMTSSSGATAQTERTDSTMTSRSATGAQAGQRLDVKSVKMVSATCS